MFEKVLWKNPINQKVKVLSDNLLKQPHEWLYPPNLTVAAEVQRLLAQQVRIEDDFPQSIQTLGGADISNNPYDATHQIYAALVMLDSQRLNVLGTAHQVMTATLPYRTGFLGFREAPALVKAFGTLTQKPDVLLVDGHGVSHPRGLGIASHIGVLLDLPTIGVAKSILVGHPAGELGETPGSRTPLVWKGKTIGTVFRSKARSNPLYIAAGHRVSQETAVEIVAKALRGYRLPEPTRHAHLAANALRRSHKGLGDHTDETTQSTSSLLKLLHSQDL